VKYEKGKGMEPVGIFSFSQWYEVIEDYWLLIKRALLRRNQTV
jgi:hypothetical protein